jgi:protein-tyrosine-phosphatase|tara:strand:+ start:5474 stop:5920 length:447 start_codon:yes stop_codon:yes gene_type:complete
MIEEKKSIGFVCLANYCRSPVAKTILKNKFKDSLKVDSAGINPMVSAGMDSRSIDYLKENNIAHEIHNPKKIDKNFLNSSDIVFAMDALILMHLNKTYKNFRHKFKLFTHQQRNVQINDPYKMSEEEYKIIMDKIKFVVERFELEELC